MNKIEALKSEKDGLEIQDDLVRFAREGWKTIGEDDKERNVALLKDRSWFDIPVVYNNNRRAILALEKGTPGERAFAEAFTAWRQ